MIQEETGKVSTYVISPRDVGVASTEGTKHMQFPTAMATNPRDANQLLIAYGASSLVYLWDLAKRKVVREYTFTNKKSAASPLSRSSSTLSEVCNSPQTLSWHSSGKRFAAGYKYGGFAVFRVDKNHGHYHSPALASESDGDDDLSPITQIRWVSAPPNSKNSHLPGAIIYAGGASDGSPEKNALTLVCPPKGVPADDAISDFMKSEQLAWRVASIPSVNNAEIASFAISQEQVDYCSKIAPLSVIVLSGNPLDGCLPSVSVQPLPCFIRFREGDKEDWEWNTEQLPPPCAIPPLLQFSPLSTFSVVNLMRSDGALQDDLFTTWEQEKHDPLFRLLASDDFEWPINGGSVLEPLLNRFLFSSGAIKDEMHTIFQNGTMLLTGHQNGFVLFWELVPPAERASKGALNLLHVIDVPLQMSPIPATKDISCLSFCHEARVLVVGFATGEIAVLEFGQWKQRRRSSLLESHFATENENLAGGASDADREAKIPPSAFESQGKDQLSAGMSQKDVTGFKTLFSLHIHSQSIKDIKLSSAYGYIAAADAGGVVSLIQISSQAYKLLIIDLASSEEDPVSVDSLLMSELVQVTDIPSPLTSGGGVGRKPSKMSPTRSGGLSRSSGTDAAFVTQHREVVPVLFVGRGNGKLEMFHVQSGTKMAESLVDPRKASSLSSIIMVDADGKRIDIPGRVWVEQGDGMTEVASPDDAAVSTESQRTERAEQATQGEGDTDGMSSNARHIRSPSTELESTKQIVLDVIDEQSVASSSDVVLVQNEERLVNATATSTPTETWERNNIIEVIVPAGSLGLHLFTDIEQHAVVKGFVSESANAGMIEAKGVHAGHVITSINGLDVTSYGRQVVCGVLGKLRDREKVIIFAEGFSFVSSDEVMDSKDIGVFNDILSDGTNHTDVERPRFLVCTCGKTIHLVQAAIPKASEMASGPKEMLARPLASVEVRAVVLATSVIRVPVSERVENCLVAIDQSNHLYVISLLGLEIIWEMECFSLGNSLDGIRSEVSYGGELVVANSFGEIERFSFFSEHTAIENALLERKCIKTRLHLEERRFPFEREHAASPKKKGIADAGKMFKKLVSGMKDVADLNKVFQFSKEEDEREQLMGDRSSTAKASAADDPNGTKKISKGMGDTKDALMQATQVRSFVSNQQCLHKVVRGG